MCVYEMWSEYYSDKHACYFCKKKLKKVLMDKHMYSVLIKSLNHRHKN